MSELGTVALGALIIAVVSLTVAAVAFVMWWSIELDDEAIDGILAFAVALALCVCVMATVVAVGAGLLRVYVWMTAALEVTT